MRLHRLSNPDTFTEVPEVAMDVHIGRTSDREPQIFVIVGGRVAISLESDPGAPFEDYLSQRWLAPGVPAEERAGLFEEWLHRLPPSPDLEPQSSRDFGQPAMLTLSGGRQLNVLAFIVGPLAPLLAPPPRPASIYGHLPFGTMTDDQTIIYRWEAFPTSWRIMRTPDGKSATIARDTYAAPASEAPFAPTGFAAVGRFALPNLLPACFRWELQPVKGLIECGASVPLYGQSGGGVEVRFPKRTTNRCPVADPVLLPAM